jgi:hypothetical protein
MKIVIRTVFFHFFCILVFAIFYYIFKKDFKSNIGENKILLDYLFLSTTIQAGVGMSDIYPISFYGKLLMISQQLIMIMTHVFTIYIFNV